MEATSSSESFFFEPGLGALPGFFGLGFVNFVGLNRQIGKDRDVGSRHSMSPPLAAKNDLC